MDAELRSLLLKKATALLARRAYSRAALRSKLAPTAGEAEVESALDRLEQLNLLNDAEYAYNFALCRIQRQGWGPAKVRDSLLRRQVAPSAIAGALKRVQNELGDESALLRYIEKHCGKQGPPADLKGIRRLVLHLRQRGFHEDSILGALKQLIPAAVLERFETGE
jgi:regulatory protein